MFSLSILALLFLLLIGNLCFGQDSCSIKKQDSIILNPGREIDSIYNTSKDRWTYISYEIEQDNYSEVHLKYFHNDKWTEIGYNSKLGVSVLGGCIPPNSMVLLEAVSINKQPKILKQNEIIY